MKNKTAIKLSEKMVRSAVCVYLEEQGYEVKPETHHGPDIVTKFHKIRRRQYIIEAKGEAGQKVTTLAPIMHNAFYTMLGQIVSRMDTQGNHPKRGKIYALAVPSAWIKVFANKISQMKYVWRLLGLRIFFVQKDMKVKEYANRKLLCRQNIFS